VNPPPSNPEGSAPRLRDIQRAFATGIMRPLTAEDGMQPVWVDGRKTEDVVQGFIKPNDRLTSFDRLEIYNRQYWYRLLASFDEDFPALRTLLGNKRFTALAEAYLTQYRSNSFTLRDLGNRLGQFLQEEPAWIKSCPRLAHDVVALEWAHIVAFDSEALPPLEIDQLLGQDPATLRLNLQPHLTLLACAYPVDEYVLAVRRREEPQGEASNAVAERIEKAPVKKVARPKAGKTWLAIHRSNNAVYYKRLDPAAHTLLAHLRDGATLQTACEAAAAEFLQPADFAPTLQGWFTQWSTFGWFCPLP
jgi:hypothetical protein